MASEKKRLEAALESLRAIRDELEDIVETRADYFQTRSERWQDGDKGTEHTDRTSYIETASASVGEAISTLEEMDG